VLNQLQCPLEVAGFLILTQLTNGEGQGFADEERGQQGLQI